MRSIHRNLRNGLLIGQGVLWALAAVGVWISVRAQLYSEFDNELRFTSAALRFQVRSRSLDEQIERRWPEFLQAGSGWYFQAWRGDGTVLNRSKNLGDLDLPRPEQPDTGYWPNRGYAIEDFIGPTGEKLRSVSVESQSPSPRFSTIVLFARSREDLDRSLQFLTIAVILAGMLAAGATTLLVRISVRRGLLPLRQMGEKAASIDVSNLSTRFQHDDLPVELQPISTRLNDLLERIEAGFARERQFSSDLAHEMRTPVSELKSIAELLVRWPEESDRAQHGEILAIANQMQGMIESLLTLSRWESAIESPELEKCALSPLIDECWKPHAGRAAEKNLEYERNLSDSKEVRTDPNLLRLIVNNLISNAVEYTPEKGLIRIESGDEDGAFFSISNHVNGLTEEDVSHLMERFWRHDASRTGDDHLGLGLSVAAACARRLDLTLTAELDEEERWLRFHLAEAGAEAEKNIS